MDWEAGWEELGLRVKASSCEFLDDPSPVKSNSVHTAPVCPSVADCSSEKKICPCCLVSKFMTLTKSRPLVLLGC